MADNAIPIINNAQDITRSVYGTVQGIVETQFNIVHRLAGVQQGLLNQSTEAANDQLQLVSRVHDPREYAYAQADLVKRHGQRYVDTVKEAISIVAQAWQEFGDRLEKGFNETTDKAQRASASRKTA